MKFTRRRRTYRLLGFIVFAAALYISFQLFSMKLLSRESDDSNKRYEKILDSIQLDLIDKSKQGNHGNVDDDQINVNKIENEKLILQNKNAYLNKVKIDDNVNKLEFKRTNNIYDKKIIMDNTGEKVHHLRDNELNIKRRIIEKFEQPVMVPKDDPGGEFPFVRKLRTEYPRGVPESLALLYIPNMDGQFICLQTKLRPPLAHVGIDRSLNSLTINFQETIQTVILFSRINDDFCDCEDSSDEPGTDACPNSRFYCQYQLNKNKLISVPSSRVNDGICDCCDGSDEWNGNTVPAFISGKKSSQGLTHSPCENTCMKLEEQNKADARLRRMGEQLKETYLQEGAAIENPNMLYGLHGEYYKLSKDCFSYKTVEYNYRVCPFESAKQNTQIIGRSPSWETRRDGKRVLRMSKGDAYGCAGRDREVVIEFMCGLHDQVISVNEDERCLYSIKFLTPAAC